MPTLRTTLCTALFAVVIAFGASGASVASAQSLTLVNTPAAGSTRFALFLVDAGKLRDQSTTQAKAHLVDQLTPFGLTPAYVNTDFNGTPIVCGAARFGVSQMFTYDHAILPLQTVEDGPEGLTLDRGVSQIFAVNFHTPFSVADPYDPGRDVHVHFDTPMNEFGFVASFTMAAGGALICDTLHIRAYSDVDQDGDRDTLYLDFAPRVDQVEWVGVRVPTGFTDLDFEPRYADGSQGVIVMGQTWYHPWVATAGVGDDAFTTLECSAPMPSPSRGDVAVRFTLPAAGRVSAQVYDASGRLVRTLLDAQAAPGLHEARWDGRAADGARAQAGVYFVRIAAGGSVATKKLVRVN